MIRRVNAWSPTGRLWTQILTHPLLMLIRVTDPRLVYWTTVMVRPPIDRSDHAGYPRSGSNGMLSTAGYNLAAIGVGLSVFCEIKGVATILAELSIMVGTAVSSCATLDDGNPGVNTDESSSVEHQLRSNGPVEDEVQQLEPLVAEMADVVSAVVFGLSWSRLQE